MREGGREREGESEGKREREGGRERTETIMEKKARNREILKIHTEKKIYIERNGT